MIIHTENYKLYNGDYISFYNDAIEKDKAYHMILVGECGVFSPKLMQCFRECRKQFEELADKYDMLEASD